MINSLKTFAFFSCTLTSRYRKGLCRLFNTVATELGVNIVYFNSLGKIGNKYALYGNYESSFLDYVDVDVYDGIIFDGEGYTVSNMRNKVIEKLRHAKCPVVSISSRVDGFYNIDFDDAGGLKMLVEHFIEIHHFTKIGYMSGYLTHPDAQIRLAEFRTVMREHGLPEDGAGMFEGDFWFHKGEEAADYFLSLPERPEAIVCANDYMAIALATSLKKRGLQVPEDIALTGYDGTVEGAEFLPHITSVTRERYDIARKTLNLLINLANGKKYVGGRADLTVSPKPVITQSCGCVKLDYRREAENINHVYEVNRDYEYNLYDAESIILKLNLVDSIPTLNRFFLEEPINFGAYSHLLMMTHIDSAGRPSYDSDYGSPTGNFVPAVWIDVDGNLIERKTPYTMQALVPEVNDNKPHFFYLMSIHCAERMFGYSVVEMVEKEVFNEFYNVMQLNVSITLERILANNRISKLIQSLENLSIRDGLTGLLNRRGFEELSRAALASLEEPETVCTMVIDMDGLKYINDKYGHNEGDCAIRAAGEVITGCCVENEIAGRAGGDEFFIFAASYDERKVLSFIKRFNNLIKDYNRSVEKPYKLEMSYGVFITKADQHTRLEDLLSVSDERMYEQKQAKPNRRK